MISAWAVFLIGNGLAVAAPSVYGYNVLHGPGRGVTVHCASVTCFYLATALSKTAFATTLLRLTGGWIKTVVRLILVVVWVFGIALMIMTWLKVCHEQFEYDILPKTCVPAADAVGVQVSNAACMLAVDIAMATIPWFVIRKVDYIPYKERCAVAACMSFVGLSGVVGMGKIIVASYIPSREQGEVDYTCKSLRVPQVIPPFLLADEIQTVLWQFAAFNKARQLSI